MGLGLLSHLQLESAEAKVWRADHHIKALDEAFERFRDLDPYAVGLKKLDLDLAVEPPFLRAVPLPTGELWPLGFAAASYTAAITLTPRLQPPLVEWGAIIGDIVHNLASALDNLVWALSQVKANHPEPAARHPRPGRERDISFPYCRSYKDWRDACRGRLFLVDPAGLAILEEAQPFNAGKHGWKGPDDHPLWVLHQLWNRDKHRAVNLTTVSGECTDIRVRFPGMPASAPDLVSDVIQAWPSRPIHDETEVAKVRIHFPQPVYVLSKPKVDVYGKFTMQIRFDEVGAGQDLNAITLLADAQDIIADVIEKLG